MPSGRLLFVQLADAVSHLCKALHKLVEKSLQPRHCKNYSQRHFDYEPLSSCPTHRYLRPFSLSTFCVTESHLARVQSCGKVFSHVKAASVFLLVSDYRAWPGRSNEELLSCQRDRETAQLLFRLIWKLNLSSGATLRLSSSGANRSS